MVVGLGLVVVGLAVLIFMILVWAVVVWCYIVVGYFDFAVCVAMTRLLTVCFWIGFADYAAFVLIVLISVILW